MDLKIQLSNLAYHYGRIDSKTFSFQEVKLLPSHFLVYI